jgi:MYXO-CTERM domain-containing protein
MSSGRTRLAIVCLGLGVTSAPAWASTGYPAELQSQLQLSKTPDCTLCHGNDVDAGTGAATKFGMAMVQFGLVGGNNLPSLDGALAGLEGTMSPLIADLKNGADPNGTAAGTIPPVTYGCFQSGGQAPSAGPGAILAAGLALLFLFRPRGKR